MFQCSLAWHDQPFLQLRLHLRCLHCWEQGELPYACIKQCCMCAAPPALQNAYEGGLDADAADQL